MAKIKPGEVRNPKGRPKGARSKLSELFLENLFKDWEAHGEKTIRSMRTEDPARYCAMIASLLPKEVNVQRVINDASDLTDDELKSIINEAAGLAGTEGTEEAGSIAQSSNPVH